MKVALVLVDVQKDFFPGGALATPEGDRIVQPVNRLIDMFERKSLPIFATRDWHPENHCSFKDQGGEWPPHCIQGSEGAQFKEEIELPDDATIISKAQSPDQDAYSGFDGTDLAEQLKQQKMAALVVGGLATDVCVKHTVFDAFDQGFAVTVVREAISGVEAQPGDSKRAIQAMKDKGARFVLIDALSL